ncbi:MAG: SRPBCC family protein [Planctomycetota bacterium]|jgi:hypothetical protein
MWKNLLLLVLSLGSIALGLGWLLPGEISGSADFVTSGDPEWVFEQVQDLESWTEWSHLSSGVDASGIFETVHDTGAGQLLRFTGPVVGQGILELTLFAYPVELAYEQLDNMGEVTARGSFRFEGMGGATRVVHEEERPVPPGPLARYRAQSRGKRQLQEELEARLARLEAYLLN